MDQKIKLSAIKNNNIQLIQMESLVNALKSQKHELMEYISDRDNLSIFYLISIHNN